MSDMHVALFIVKNLNEENTIQVCSFRFMLKSVFFAYISSQLCFLRHFVILYDLITVTETQ